MALRRDVSRSLLLSWNDDRRFADVMRAHVEAGRVKRREAERLVIRYHQDRQRLLVQLDDWAHR